MTWSSKGTANRSGSAPEASEADRCTVPTTPEEAARIQVGKSAGPTVQPDSDSLRQQRVQLPQQVAFDRITGSGRRRMGEVAAQLPPKRP